MRQTDKRTDRQTEVDRQTETDRNWPSYRQTEGLLEDKGTQKQTYLVKHVLVSSMGCPV